MKDRFSIENFVEDSVPSIEDNDIIFRSISDEIDKRIAAAAQRTKKKVISRAQSKISRINKESPKDTEQTERQDFRIPYGADAEELQSGEETFFEENEECEIEIDRAMYQSAMEGVWCGSVLSRLRTSGCIKSGTEQETLYTELSSGSGREPEIPREKRVSGPDMILPSGQSVDAPVSGKRSHDTFTEDDEPAEPVYGTGLLSYGESGEELPGMDLQVMPAPDVLIAAKDANDAAAETVEAQFRREQSQSANREFPYTEKKRNRVRLQSVGDKKDQELQTGQPVEGFSESKAPADMNAGGRIHKRETLQGSAGLTTETPKPVIAQPMQKNAPKRKYSYPAVDLIRPESEVRSKTAGTAQSEEETRIKAAKLVDTLKSFGIGITITGITRGPSVTRFEFQPEVGVKISKIVALTDDIALNLAASAVRMEAPIPGKPAIGIEIPNEQTDTVYLYDVLNTPEYRAAKSKISFALGKDIEGRTVIADLAKMPHVLIAGSTGSGKSVCINTIISGILYGASPDEVKFIMIDPKVVELGIYNSIPHLLIPVVTEPKKASAALAWAVMEVERRYHLFAEHNVRDIFSFNRGIKERPEMAGFEKMPQIVIIIDELADLMMVASQDVEKSIIRLAQKARAAGVHLVIATQRPSVDVITGIIKANIPSRIAFAVASQFDSRTILDNAGAEKLLGRGDMLYHPIGSAKSVRVQGAFISDSEVERITEFVKNSYGLPEYDSSVAESIENAVLETQKNVQGGKPQQTEDTEESSGDDELIESAAELGFSLGQLSISLLQRKLKLGYSRAARIIDALEELGFLSAADGSKPRQVLMTREEFQSL